MSEFTVCIPGHSPHYRCWEELAVSVRWALQQLGHTAHGESQPRPGSRAIYLGWPLNPPSADAIFYNTEQVSKDSYWQHNALYTYYKDRTVWDYSPVNASRFGQYDLPAPPVVRPGFCPLLKDRFGSTTKTHDITFFGSTNERREHVLRQIAAQGLSLLRVPFGIYGVERDKLLAQSRLCLNIHFYETAIFESVRCSYLALNNIPVLSELSAGEEAGAYGMQGVAYDQLAAIAAGLVRKASSLEDLAAVQHLGVKNVSMVDDIGQALERLDSTDVARVQISVPSNLPELTLCMIVKDEAGIIERCLASVKPYIKRYSILDTGSTDGTQDIIRRFMGDVPGTVHERPWKEFDGSRTEAINIARKEANDQGWLLLIDADELISITDLQLPDGYDCYDSIITRCEECVRWKRPTFLRANKPWYFDMPRHEGLYSKGHAPTHPEPAVGSFILSLPDGARAKESEHDRFLRDAKILEEWLKTHPGHTRCQYYLAQSYRDAATGKQPLDRAAMQQAVTHYLRRASMGHGNHPVEQFSALYRAAQCMEQCGYPWERIQDTLLRAWQMRPSRAEPLHHLAVYHRGQKQYVLAEMFARRAVALPMTSDIFSDVNRSVYEWRAKEELSVALSYLDGHKEALALNREIISIAPVGDRPRIQANLDMCARVVG